jgi:enamine deaminase RidA (YjgF/YER057c/UK114 family)
MQNPVATLADAEPAPLVYLNPAGLYDPTANGYSHVAVAQTPARLVYLAGQGGESETGELSPDFALQVRQALRNLKTALAAAGTGVADVARLMVLVVDHTPRRLEIFGSEMRDAWDGFPAPPCTLIPVPRLALDGMLFEIEATAVVPVGKKVPIRT